MKRILISLCLALAACAPMSLAPATEPPLTIDAPTATPSPQTIQPTPSRELPTLRALATVEPTQPPELAVLPAALWERIAADLETRTGASRAAFTSVQAEAVVWNDGSLGCPQPGGFYAQVLVEGYRVRVEWGGQQFDYHTAQSGFFVLCQRPGPQLGGTPRPAP